MSSAAFAPREPQTVATTAAAIASVLTAMALVVLDAGMVNVALPTMARELAASPARAVQVVTAYQTALVMALLPCAALGERFGNRRVFRAGVTVFVAASVCCAVSPSLPWLIFARLLQGFGGAAVMALGVALLRTCVLPDRLGAAVGWNALVVALASAAAPTLGALIVTGFDWPALFLVNVPLAAMALLAGQALPRATGAARPIDVVSIALNGASFALMVFAAEALPTAPLTAALLLALAAAGFTLLVRREAPRPAPLLPLDLLRNASFRLSVIASICCFTGQAAGMVALPFYLQHNLGQSPLAVGLFLSPWPLAVAATSVVAGSLSDRFPTAWLCAGGAALLALGLAAIAVWPLSDGPWLLLPLAALCGVGFGLFQVPNNRNLFLAAPPDRSGAAGGMQGTARLTGQMTGALLVGLLFTAAPLAAAPKLGLAAGAVFSLLAALFSILRTPRKGVTANAAI